MPVTTPIITAVMTSGRTGLRGASPFSVAFRYGEGGGFLDTEARDTDLGELGVKRVDAAPRDLSIVVVVVVVDAGVGAPQALSAMVWLRGWSARVVRHALRPVGGFVVAGEDPLGDRMVFAGGIKAARYAPPSG